MIFGAGCVGGDAEDRVAASARPLAVYNHGPSTCKSGYGVTAFLAGVFDCRKGTGTVPITEASCPGAQWLWTGAPNGSSSSTGNPKGNAYCAEYNYTGVVDWGSYPNIPEDRIARVQEIGGLWVPSMNGAVFNGCGKNIRVCLGPPTRPGVTAIHGVHVPGCSDTGPAGCAVCTSVQFRKGEVPNATDTCCTEGFCLRHTLSLTMQDQGEISSDLAGFGCTGGTCAAEYSDLAKVTLTRTDRHVDWTGWIGACPRLSDTCAISMASEQSVVATYELGGTIAGGVVPAGGDAALPRDDGKLIARRASTVRVAMSGTGYTFDHDGVCSCFVPDGDGFLCGRPTAGSGTITVTHLASGASRVLAIEFVERAGASPAGQISLGTCQASAARR